MTENTQETLHFLDYWRVIRSRKEIIIAVFLVVVVTGILVTYSLPKQYMASVVVQVKDETRELDVWRAERRWFDPLFLRTQFEIIQSRPILEAVIRKTNLDEKLSKAYQYDSLAPEKSFEQTFKILARAMRVQQYRDTNLIEIQITMSEPRETVTRLVAELAQTVADVYRQERTKRTKDAKLKALKALASSLDEQRSIVIQKEQVVQDVIEKYELDVIDMMNESVRSLISERVRNLETLRVAARMDLVDKKATLDIITELPREQLRSVGPRFLKDPELLALLSSMSTAEVKLEEAQSLYGTNHPQVASIRAAVGELDSKITDALTAMERGVDSEYRKSKAKFDILDEELSKLTQQERSAKSGEYQEYQKAFEDAERAKDIRDALEVRHVQEEIIQRIPVATVTVVEPPKAPDVTDPVSPNVLLNIVLSVIVGLGAGVSLAYFVEYLDTSVKTIEDIERNLGMSVLGVIPQKVKSFLEEGTNTAHAEAYRVLRTNIQFSKKMTNGKLLCVTSGSVGEGKSLTLFNLACIYAELGDRTIVVDTDLHRPRQHKMVGVSNALGIANVLVDEVALEDVIVPTAQPNLDFLPSGKLAGGVHGLLDTLRMKEVVEELTQNYDMVFLDSPPIIGVSDASFLVRECDGVLLVIQHRKYPLDLSIRARSMVENLGGNLIGVVMNNINISRDYSYYYYHHHYYSYPQGSKGNKTVSRRPSQRRKASGEGTST